MRLAVVAAALTGIAVHAPAASASSDSRLPLPAYGDIVVDDVHDRLFISGGPTTNGIVVTDFSGTVKKTITSQPGATGMVLSADSSTLYAALASGDAVSAISTTTYAETARYPIGAQTCPTHLARTGPVVWFGYGCESDWTGKIGKLDTAAVPPATSLDQQGDALFQRAPLLGAPTADAGPLVAGQLSLSLSTVRVFGTAGGTLTEQAAGDVVGASLTDLSLTPDGTTLYTASGSRDHAEAFDPADLSRSGAYSTGFRPDAVVPSADGAFLAIGRNTSGKDDVLVYEAGGLVPENKYSLDSSEIVAPRGLAFSGDDKRLFVITQAANSTVPDLAVISHPTD